MTKGIVQSAFGRWFSPSKIFLECLTLILCLGCGGGIRGTNPPMPRIISGVVVDSDNNPVDALLEFTSQSGVFATETDKNGNYSTTISANNSEEIKIKIVSGMVEDSFVTQPFGTNESMTVNFIKTNDGFEINNDMEGSVKTDPVVSNDGTTKDGDENDGTKNKSHKKKRRNGDNNGSDGNQNGAPGDSSEDPSPTPPPADSSTIIINIAYSDRSEQDTQNGTEMPSTDVTLVVGDQSTEITLRMANHSTTRTATIGDSVSISANEKTAVLGVVSEIQQIFNASVAIDKYGATYVSSGVMGNNPGNGQADKPGKKKKKKNKPGDNGGGGAGNGDNDSNGGTGGKDPGSRNDGGMESSGESPNSDKRPLTGKVK